jgi:hypothetical protein
MSVVTDKAQIKEAKKRDKFQRDTELDEVKWVLSSKKGRNYIWRLLGRCGIYTQSFHQNNSIMSFNEGRRAVGNEVLIDINEADPDGYFAMMRENRELKNNESSSNTNDDE